MVSPSVRKIIGGTDRLSQMVDNSDATAPTDDDYDNDYDDD